MTVTPVASQRYFDRFPHRWGRLTDDILRLTTLAEPMEEQDGREDLAAYLERVAIIIRMFNDKPGTWEKLKREPLDRGDLQMFFIADTCRALVQSGLLPSREERNELAVTCLDFATALASHDLPDELWERAQAATDDRTPDERLRDLVKVATQESGKDP